MPYQSFGSWMVLVLAQTREVYQGNVPLDQA